MKICREVIGETLGTCLLVLFGCGSVAVTVLFQAHQDLLPVALLWGVGVTLAIYLTRHLSCAHLNPAVTLAMAASGRMSWRKVPSYVGSQLAGALLPRLHSRARGRRGCGGALFCRSAGAGDVPSLGGLRLPEGDARVTAVGRYFDYAASAPPFSEALAAQAEAARRAFGNPSAAHAAGRAAAQELRRLKGQLSRLLDLPDGRVVLMSGATEANNWVIRSVMRRFPQGRILVAADVHASVWESARLFAERLDVLTPDREGRVTLAELAAALSPDTRLFCCSHVSNETGVIHDVAALSSLCARRGVLCHADGAQAAGHVRVRLSELCCEFYVFAAHKFGGPRGSGGVCLRWDGGEGWLVGGGQEGGLRAGTENVPGLAGAVVALERSLAQLPQEAVRLRELACRLARAARAADVACRVNGDPASGLPGLVSLSFPGLDGHALAADLDQQGFAVGTGSACSASKPEPSRALLAMGLMPREALGTVRVSMGRLTREEDAGALIAALSDTVRRHRLAEGR